VTGQDGVVLDVPAAAPLGVDEARLAIDKDFALALRLCAQRIVAIEEADGEHAAAGEARLVPAGRSQIDRRPLPALDLQAIEDGRRLVPGEVGAQIGAGDKIVRDVTENCRTLKFKEFGFEENLQTAFDREALT
jgi:hypothetical protein